MPTGPRARCRTAISCRRITSSFFAVARRSPVNEPLEQIYRDESRRVLATLIRLLGDFDLAEEALHDAFAAAADQWPSQGIPANPRAWLVSTGRFQAIDQLRRRARHDAHLAGLAQNIETATAPEIDVDDPAIADDRLRLVFTCCHPSLALEAQLALTLREMCGLTTEQVARAFLVKPATVAQRIVRAKAKIRDAGIPYSVPEGDELAERLHAVLYVVYLLFNEGYSAAEGDSLLRPDVAAEAIRLGRILHDLLPEPEIAGLLALMLLHDARRAARATSAGDLILLEDQDRELWDREQIREGCALVRRALEQRRVGPFQLQAAIAAVHAEAPSAAATDWQEIVGLYDVLVRVQPSPVIALNRAVAVAMRDGPEAGLRLIDALLARGELLDYHLAHAARADLCRRLRRIDDACESYERALALAKQAPERRFLARRLAELAA